MTTLDVSDILSTTTLTSLIVAGVSLGAIYAFHHTLPGQLVRSAIGSGTAEGGGGGGGGEPFRGRDDTRNPATNTTTTTTTTTRKSRRRKKGTREDDSNTVAVGQRGGSAPATTASTPSPRVVPGDLTAVGPPPASAPLTDHPPSSSDKGGSKSRQEKRKRKTPPRPATAQAQRLDADADDKPPTVAPGEEVRGSLALDTDSSWTHVRPRRGRTDGMTTSSDVASTTSESSPVAAAAARDPRVPRPKALGVVDMRERTDDSTPARVMRVQPPADEAPVPGFSWEDYGDVVAEESVLVHDADEEDEGEWDVVKSRHRARHPQTTATMSASTSHTPSVPETMTKKQRQNARKRELAKSAKADAEAARLQGLAQHQRELERVRIMEQSRQGGGKKPSGGMHASIDDRGKLVWE